MNGISLRQASGFVASWAAITFAILAAQSLMPIRWVQSSAIGASIVIAVAQWILLRDRVSWAAHWAIGSAAGEVLRAVVLTYTAQYIRQLAGLSFPLSYSYSLILNLIAVLPVVLVLMREFAGRAFILMAIVPATILISMLGGPILRLLPLADIQWLFAINATLTAVVKACLLVWLSHGDVIAAQTRTTRSTAPMTTRPAAQPPLGPGALVAVASLLVIMIVAAAVILLSGNEGNSRSAVKLAAMIACPYVAALICISSERWRRFGLGLVAGGAGGATIVVTPFAAFFSLMLGFAANASQLYGGMAMLGVVPLNAALAYAGYRALRKIAPPGQRAGAIVGGAGSVAGYAMLVVIISSTPTRPASVVGGQAVGGVNAAGQPADRAFRVAGDILRCLQQRSAAPEQARPATVDDLGPAGLNCLTPETLHPSDRAYEVRVTTAPSKTERPMFSVCVTYARTPEQLYGGHVIDERLAAPSYLSPAATPVLACSYAFHDRVRALRYCLWTFAGEHDGGYPSTLDEIEGCFPAEFRRTGPPLTYVPGAADENGKVATFVAIQGVSGDDAKRPHSPRWRLDERGAINVTTEPRLPTPSDAIDTVANERIREQVNLEQAGVFTLERACEQDASTCSQLAAALERRGARWRGYLLTSGGDAAGRTQPDPALEPLIQRDWARAFDLYRSGCDRLIAEDCAHAVSVLTLIDPNGSRSGEARDLHSRGCALALSSSCKALASLGGGGAGALTGNEGMRVFVRACDAGAGSACTAAARLLLTPTTASNVRALELFEKGCALGDQESCWGAARLHVAGGGVPANPVRAAYYSSLACSSAPFPAGCPAR